MNITTKIALRFITATRSQRGLRFFSFVTFFSLMATISLFVLIDSIMQGLSGHLEKSLVGFEAPLFLETRLPREQVEKKFGEFVSQHGYSDLVLLPVRQFDGLIRAPGESSIGVRVRVVSLRKLNSSSQSLDIFWREGFDQSSLASGKAVLVGEHLYGRLRFLPGEPERVEIIHPFAELSPAGDFLPSRTEALVAGYFKSGLYEFDDLFVLGGEDLVAALGDPLMMPLEYFVDAPIGASVQKISELWNFTNSEIRMKSWLDRNDNRVRAARLERFIMFLMFVGLLLLSSLNLAVLISLMGIHKTPEAAILRALGASQKFIFSLYVRIGVIIGATGTLCGIIVGVGLSLILKRIDLPVPEVYVFAKLPFEIRPLVLLGIAVLSPIFSFLVSLWPAYRLSKLTVIKGMKQG